MRAARPTLALAGRSPQTAAIARQLERLRALGARASYRQTDVGRMAAVDDLILQVEREAGALCGIIHIAGVTADGYLHAKTSAELQRVFAPKVHGVVNLDRASRRAVAWLRPRAARAACASVAARSASRSARMPASSSRFRDRASADYRRFLTPAQYAARFGVPAATLQRTVDWLKAGGARVQTTSQSRDYVEFSATVSQVSST